MAFCFSILRRMRQQSRDGSLHGTKTGAFAGKGRLTSNLGITDKIDVMNANMLYREEFE